MTLVPLESDSGFRAFGKGLLIHTMLTAMSMTLLGCSAPVKRCEFPLWVTVTPDPDTECRALMSDKQGLDDGTFVKDVDIVLGCAPKDRIITNGTESNMGHELKHHVDRNCRK